MLTDRYNGITYLLDRHNGRYKLTMTEEQTIVQYILNLNSRGFPPWLCEVADIADKLLTAWGKELVGKNWVKRFITHLDKFKIAFN